MFRKSKNSAVFFAPYNRGITFQRRGYFFTNKTATRLFSPDYTIEKYFVKDDLEQEATHIEIRNSRAENSETLVKKVYAIISQHSNCHLTLMTPTILFDYGAKHKSRQDNSKGYINPGHIHFSCTTHAGNVMDNGDSSFSSTGESIEQMVTPVLDSRLIGYQPKQISICVGKFTTTAYETRKWAKLAEKYQNYPLYILAKPFRSEEDRRKYLKEVAALKKQNTKNFYALMSYYKTGTDEIQQANNCVTNIKTMAERFFDIRLTLGDNPTTQTAYLELIKHLCDVPHPRFNLFAQVEDFLSKVHHETLTYERYSLVI